MSTDWTTPKSTNNDDYTQLNNNNPLTSNIDDVTVETIQQQLAKDQPQSEPLPTTTTINNNNENNENDNNTIINESSSTENQKEEEETIQTQEPKDQSTTTTTTVIPPPTIQTKTSSSSSSSLNNNLNNNNPLNSATSPENPTSYTSYFSSVLSRLKNEFQVNPMISNYFVNNNTTTANATTTTNTVNNSAQSDSFLKRLTRSNSSKNTTTGKDSINGDKNIYQVTQRMKELKQINEQLENTIKIKYQRIFYQLHNDLNKLNERMIERSQPMISNMGSTLKKTQENLNGLTNDLMEWNNFQLMKEKSWYQLNFNINYQSLKSNVQSNNIVPTTTPTTTN